MSESRNGAVGVGKRQSLAHDHTHARNRVPEQSIQCEVSKGILKIPLSNGSMNWVDVPNAHKLHPNRLAERPFEPKRQLDRFLIPSFVQVICKWDLGEVVS